MVNLSTSHDHGTEVERCSESEYCKETTSEQFYCRRLVTKDSGVARRLCERTRRVVRGCLGRCGSESSREDMISVPICVDI